MGSSIRSKQPAIKLWPLDDTFAVGHYVGESDIVSDPVRAERSFAQTNWQRLQALRRTDDPDALFHGHFSA